KGLLNPGDHVIISPLEHNAVIRPLKRLELLGVELTVAKGDFHGRVSFESVAHELRPNTKLICVSHASNVTGAIQPITEIGALAHEHGIFFMVDGSQTAGHVPIDVQQMHIDLLAVPGHKGLLGPQGTGALYTRKEILLRPLIEGGTGSQSENPHQPDFIPDRYESGTLNTPGIAGLNAGIQYLFEKGVGTLQAHDQSLTRQSLEALEKVPGLHIYGPLNPDERTGTVALNLTGQDCNMVCEMLDQQFDIAVRGGLHCAWLAHRTLGTLHSGAVRLSWGAFNTEQDVQDAASALRTLLAG
ncbi:TPA: cysteine desulfurase, partial [Candidatus Sumerlaeota bacterium]|nr:cysteine desulfurase [Candidatus Sumerlaeota bacterium]